MKGALVRTKVVLRHLPPTISQITLLDQIDGTFGGRYNWVFFRPGKSSQKHLSYSRAHIDFKRPEDVIEFAEFCDGHVFVNEKGTQFKVIVEYAPSQRVPERWLKKDVREGTIHKDSEYLEFLELLAKPSAEIQLERREAERSGAGKDIPMVRPLMDFVHQKRAAKGGSRRPLPNGKVSRQAVASSSGSPSSVSSRRGSGKKRASTKMLSNSDSMSENHRLTSSAKTILGSAALKQNQRHEGSGRVIRNILSSKDLRQKSPSAHSEQQIQTSNLEREKRTPEDKVGGNDLHVSNGRHEERVRHKDKPDHGVRTNRSKGGDESLSSSPSLQFDSLEGTHAEMKIDTINARLEVDVPIIHPIMVGFSNHLGCRGSIHGVKDVDDHGHPISTEGNQHPRSIVSAHGSHEKQVWVQKASSGS